MTSVFLFRLSVLPGIFEFSAAKLKPIYIRIKVFVHVKDGATS